MCIMNRKEKIIRCLARATCDKPELNRIILKYKKCFDEACAALNGKKK